MSTRATAWALDADRSGKLTAEARIVLLVLADFAHDDGTATWPSKRTIARRLGISERAVQRAIATLLSKGVIVKGDQSLVSHIRADLRPNVYDLPIHQDLGETEATPRSRETEASPGRAVGRRKRRERGDGTGP